MAQCELLLNNGDAVLLNNGDNVLLNDNTCGVVGGVIISGTHARPSLVLPRRRQLIKHEYTFWVKATILRQSVTEFRVKATLLKECVINAKIKGSLLVKSKTHFHAKASLLKPANELRYKIEKGVIKLSSNSTIKTIKKVLLENIREIIKD